MSLFQACTLHARQIIRSWSICFKIDFPVKLRMEHKLKAVGPSFLISLNLLSSFVMD